MSSSVDGFGREGIRMIHAQVNANVEAGKGKVVCCFKCGRTLPAETVADYIRIFHLFEPDHFLYPKSEFKRLGVREISGVREFAFENVVWTCGPVRDELGGTTFSGCNNMRKDAPASEYYGAAYDAIRAIHANPNMDGFEGIWANFKTEYATRYPTSKFASRFKPSK